ncbi:zinc ribbon domain-containing protein [Prosthecobacter sp.]|uniref:zinc ribbon domain-containing protein n=1 Tax=Prosthecobacter sp. TaxID=1965333 RepID=UPI001DA1D685|nr:zinc ribbon domain-containing protein [Prosthecobacter sp.]MCB1278656.1 zinc ribbon domain-containing protein [Prosthecobacter sp.]
MSTPSNQNCCAKCGAALAEGVRFCEQCGAPVEVSPPAMPCAAPLPAKAAGNPPLLLIVVALVVGALSFAGYSQRERLLGWLKRSPAPAVTTPAPSPSATTTQTPPVSAVPVSPEVAAAQDLAEMILWFQKLPWLVELQKSMPRGVGIAMHAEPYDGGGWSEMSLRETHSKDSGFEPNVSPMVGLFRVSRADRRIEWMEPVSGEFVPLAEFLKDRGLSGGTVNTPTPPQSSARGVQGGDFETAVSTGPNSDTAVIVTDPTQKGNHVARIIGPDEMSFDLPLKLAVGTPEATIALRLLLPENTKLVRFDDGKSPEGIRLRVRLVNDIGNSIIRDAVVRPIGQWREMEFSFYDLPKKVVSVSVEAIWMEGPVYFDDVKLIPTQP